MKRINLIALTMLCSLISTAQVNLEHTYNAYDLSFGMVKLDSVTYKYYNITTSSDFTLYNLDHSVYKHVTIPQIWQQGKPSYDYAIEYISSTLFDCDASNIEYVINGNVGTSYPFFFRIIREDGTIIFSVDSARGWNCYGCSVTPARTYITNTPQGTKMYLSTNDWKTKVYGLCGNLTTGYSITSNDSQENPSLSPAYPNPTDNYTRIDYQLPEGTNKGDIVFYDMQGKEIKRFKVDKTFDHLKITTNELSSGTYYYNLQTPNEMSAGKKLIIIK